MSPEFLLRLTNGLDPGLGEKNTVPEPAKQETDDGRNDDCKIAQSRKIHDVSLPLNFFFGPLSLAEALLYVRFRIVQHTSEQHQTAVLLMSAPSNSRVTGT